MLEPKLKKKRLRNEKSFLNRNSNETKIFRVLNDTTFFHLLAVLVRQVSGTFHQISLIYTTNIRLHSNSVLTFCMILCVYFTVI